MTSPLSGRVVGRSLVRSGRTVHERCRQGVDTVGHDETCVATSVSISHSQGLPWSRSFVNIPAVKKGHNGFTIGDVSVCASPGCCAAADDSLIGVGNFFPRSVPCAIFAIGVGWCGDDWVYATRCWILPKRREMPARCRRSERSCGTGKAGANGRKLDATSKHQVHEQST